jgi:hypothetical protein
VLRPQGLRRRRDHNRRPDLVGLLPMVPRSDPRVDVSRDRWVVGSELVQVAEILDPIGWHPAELDELPAAATDRLGLVSHDQVGRVEWLGSWAAGGCLVAWIEWPEDRGRVLPNTRTRILVRLPSGSWDVAEGPARLAEFLAGSS